MNNPTVVPSGPTSEAVDALIAALQTASFSPEQNNVLRKLDHLVHALRVSGHLAALTTDQVKVIVYALFAAGHLKTASLVAPEGASPTYDQEGLVTIHNADFMTDPRFQKAYRRGMLAGGVQCDIHWRVHVAIWAASQALQLPGDFVECGVNHGFMSSAIMQYLDWNTVNRRFFLLDTFQGLDERFISDAEKAEGKSSASHGYTECFEVARKNFEEFRNVVLIRGAIPLTLPQVDSDRICYLHIDMNCVPPEIAALEYFWDKLVPGAIVLLDDYDAFSHHHQKQAMDRFAASRSVQILSLPTGQGMMLKPLGKLD
jgi:hypothetical protein